jgi:hypothetical protein
VLYEASLDRIHEASLLFDGRAWGLSMYVAGLAVEALVQALALRAGAAHDARHDLDAWLRKCPERVIDGLVPHAGWSRVVIVWRNDLRYLSKAGVLGYLRSRNLTARIKVGERGSDGVLRFNATQMLKAASAVHKKGVVMWHEG